MEVVNEEQEPNSELGSGDRDRNYGGDHVDLRVAEERLEGVTEAKAEHSASQPTELQAGHSAWNAEHSAAPLKLVPAEHSVRPASVAPIKRPVEKVSRPVPRRQTVEKKDNVVQLNTQRGLVFDKSQWKRSRKKEGYLIRRLSGYNIAETEYGISYLWVVSRKPDRTTADNSVHPAAGYFNWESLENTGLLVKERKSDRRDKTAVG
jgi:hypothetical protein